MHSRAVLLITALLDFGVRHYCGGMSGQVALYVRLVIVIDHCVVDALDIMDFGPCAMYEYVCLDYSCQYPGH